MAYQVDYSTGVIFIPQSDLIFLETGKYKLDLNEFRKKCRDLEDQFDNGLSYPPMIKYNTTVDTGDVILARVVLLINGYTVTFEDGQYAVLFDGANTNVHNYTNVNQVSIRPNNSTGLQDLSTLLSSAYQGEVVLNILGGQSGTSTPIGTLGKPSNNWSDAMVIADRENAKEINLQGLLTLADGDNAEYRIVVGSHPLNSILIVNNLSDTVGLIAKNLTFSGDLDGGAILEHCVLGQVNYFAGFINDCALTANTIFINGVAVMMACSAGSDAAHPPIIDLANATSFAIWNYNGNIKIVNCTAGIEIDVTMNGELYIDPSCTNGAFTISGDCNVNHTQTGSEYVFDNTTGSVIDVADAVFDKLATTDLP